MNAATSNVKKNLEYIPGMCNIGPAERRQRRRTGIMALIVTLVVLAVLLLIDAPSLWRLVLIIPASGAATGFLQDAFHFCVGFGMRGIYNVINSVGTTDSVDQAEYRKKDRSKAQLILVLSVVIGAVFAGLTLLL